MQSVALLENLTILVLRNAKKLLVILFLNHTYAI
jgi:hypothetical protein